MISVLKKWGGNSFLAIAKDGETIWVRHLVGETVEGFSRIEPDKGSNKITFKQDCLIVVEDVSQNLKTVKHLRFARQFREGKNLADLENKIKIWPKLRVALGQYADGYDYLHVPGGLEYAVAYSDEIIVADYSIKGSHGWIVKKSAIGDILKKLPPIIDSGEYSRTYIAWKSDGLSCESSLWEDLLYHVGPSDKEESTYFQVDYDSGSLRVTEIWELDSQKNKVSRKLETCFKNVHTGDWISVVEGKRIRPGIR